MVGTGLGLKVNSSLNLKLQTAPGGTPGPVTHPDTCLAVTYAATSTVLSDLGSVSWTD